jgi:hypothetical protein
MLKISNGGRVMFWPILTLAGVAIAIMVILNVGRPSRPIWESTPGGPYTLIITDEEIACEHPERPREVIRWRAINEIRLVTTSDGPFHPDMWFLFMGESTGCSVPSEAKDIEQIWPLFEQRFPGLDYAAIIDGGGTSDRQTTLWRRSAS